MNDSKVLSTLSVKAKKENMLPIEKLEKLVGEPDSGIEKERQEVHVALHPRYVNSIALGLINHFNKLINQWHPKLNGILAGYGRLQLKRPTGHMINEDADIHLDVQSEFWIFRPLEGRQLKGVVTKKSASHVSCLVHGVFNVPCHRPNNLSEEWWGAKVQPKQIVHFTVLKTDMSQKVPFILGDLQNEGLDGSQDFDETVPSPLVEELEDEDWSDVINHERDTSVLSKEPTEKSKKKKNKAEKKLLNESRDKSDAESMDLNGQRNDLISKVLDSSIMNDSTASSTSSKKSKKRKLKEDEKVPTNDGDSKDEKETEKTRETLISDMILNSSLAASTSVKKSKKKKKDKDKEKVEENVEKEPEVKNGPEIDISDLFNSSTTNEKKKKKKDKNRSISPPPPAIVPQSPKKSPKKSPVKEAKNETDKKAAPVKTPKKTPVKKSVVPLAAAKASPAAKASSAAKKIKDPNEPKKPLGAYMQFNQDQRLKMKAEGQKINVIEFAKEMGKKWKEMKPEDQQYYKDQHAESQKKYEIDLAAYKEETGYQEAGKKKKDPNAPKQPMTAYMQFNQEQRLKMSAEGQKVNIIEVAKELGQKWKEMKPKDQQYYKDLTAESRKKYEIDLAAYKEGTYIPPQNDEKKTIAVNEKPAEPDTSLSEKTKKKKDKKRPRSPSPTLSQPSTNNSPNTSPAKKKSRKNVSFETSTPIQKNVEENNHVENNNDDSTIIEEPTKKKSKKKKKDKEKGSNQELTPMQNHLINNIRHNFGK